MVWDRLKERWSKLQAELLYTPSQQEVADATKDFLDGEPGWVDNAIRHDPALSSKGSEEAMAELMTYQGLHAIALHRKAHALYEKGDFYESRKLSQGARRITAGIEIHPGAKIGKNFFIDHGSSVVIGETTEIGDNVFLYHGVTLGAFGGAVAEGGRRHPKIGNNITISNGAQVLGPATIDDGVTVGPGAKILGKVHIGKGAIIGAGVEVTHDVPASVRVVGSLPNWPGLLDYKSADGTQGAAGTPITMPLKPQPGTKVKDAQWFGRLRSAIQQLMGGATTREGNGAVL